VDLGVPAVVKGQVFVWIRRLDYWLAALDQRNAGGVEHHLPKLPGRPVTPSPDGSRASSPLFL